MIVMDLAPGIHVFRVSRGCSLSLVPKYGTHSVSQSIKGKPCFSVFTSQSQGCKWHPRKKEPGATLRLGPGTGSNHRLGLEQTMFSVFMNPRKKARSEFVSSLCCCWCFPFISPCFSFLIILLVCLNFLDFSSFFSMFSFFFFCPRGLGCSRSCSIHSTCATLPTTNGSCPLRMSPTWSFSCCTRSSTPLMFPLPTWPSWAPIAVVVVMVAAVVVWHCNRQR